MTDQDNNTVLPSQIDKQIVNVQANNTNDINDETDNASDGNRSSNIINNGVKQELDNENEEVEPKKRGRGRLPKDSNA